MRTYTVAWGLTLGVGCVGTGESAAGEESRWYLTCGDPACSGYGGPWEGVPACTDQAEGAPCDELGASCDPVDACNATFVCAEADPKDTTGGCPISRRAAKEGIRYLGADEVDALGVAATELPLARWSYTDDAEQTPRLGFVLEDVGGATSPLVRPAGDRVDLYAYTSLAIAGIQAQQRELERLRAELDTLRSELEASRAGECAP